MKKKIKNKKKMIKKNKKKMILKNNLLIKINNLITQNSKLDKKYGRNIHLKMDGGLDNLLEKIRIMKIQWKVIFLQIT